MILKHNYDPNNHEIFAGISGIELPIDQYDLGHGVIISKTYTHIMAPYLAAFSPALLGKPHPAPWKPVGGGLGYDICAQIYIPIDFKYENWFDRLNTIWLLLAIIRLKANPLAAVPVIANQSFSEMKHSEVEPIFWPMEIRPSRLIIDIPADKTITLENLDWIRENWFDAGSLLVNHDSLNLALQSFDGCIWLSTSRVAMVSLWGALERLFSNNNAELKFRISCYLAAYLLPSGTERLALFKLCSKLYFSRSKAAHGSDWEDHELFRESYRLTRRILLKIIEDRHIPTEKELERMLFCD